MVRVHDAGIVVSDLKGKNVNESQSCPCAGGGNGICEFSNCCAQYTACGADSACVSIGQCVQACTTQASLDDCQSQFPPATTTSARLVSASSPSVRRARRRPADRAAGGALDRAAVGHRAQAAEVERPSALAREATRLPRPSTGQPGCHARATPHARDQTVQASTSAVATTS
jgi:hypothetical protein